TAMGLDGLPDLIAREGVDARELRRLLQRLHDGRRFDGALDVLEERPAVGDELRERAARLRDGEHRERHREPAVRRAEQDGARDLGAVVLELVEVRMTPTAARQVVLADLPEGLRHALGGAARIAAHPQVLGLERGAALEETQRALAGTRPSVNEPVPREVVEVPLAAREEEARGHR